MNRVSDVLTQITLKVIDLLTFLGYRCPESYQLTLKEIEKRAIEMALQRNNWKKLATARELGIDKNTLRRKIKRLAIVLPQQ